MLEQAQAVRSCVAGDDVKIIGKGVTERVTNQWVVVHNKEQGFFSQGLSAIFVKYFTQL